MAEFEKQFGFGIDDGELDGLTRQKCFVLGFELAQIDAMLCAKVVQPRPVHPENRERIQEAAKRHGVPIELVVYHDDWLWLKRGS